jgi:hypothetical protein
MSTLLEPESIFAMPSINREVPSPREESNSNKIEASKSDEPKRRIRANVKETGLDSIRYYMKTMGNHELLNKNEEIILAREIQILIKWEEVREQLEAKLMRYVRSQTSESCFVFHGVSFGGYSISNVVSFVLTFFISNVSTDLQLMLNGQQLSRKG